MNLVEKIAKKMKWLELPYEDRLIAGYEGLEIAKERFDPNKKAKFETYAYYWIKSKIIDEGRKYGNLIRLPKNLKEKIFKVAKMQKQLKQEKGYEPSIEEIGEKLKMNKNEVKELLKFEKRSKVLPLENKIEVEEKNNSFRELALKVLSFLKPDEQKAVANYFGFEIPNIETNSKSEPSHWKIKKIIEKIQKTPEIMQFLRKKIKI